MELRIHTDVKIPLLELNVPKQPRKELRNTNVPNIINIIGMVLETSIVVVSVRVVIPRMTRAIPVNEVNML